MMFAFGAIPARCSVGVVAGARDDAGDVRAVAPVVVLGGPVVHEVDELGDALAVLAGGAGPEVVVIRRDAGVDHRDADAGAGVTVLAARREGADGRGRARHFAGDFAIDVHALDVRVVCETAEKRVRNAARVRPQQLQAATRSATGALNAIGTVVVLVVVELDDDVGLAAEVGKVVQREVELRVTLAPFLFLIG